MAYNFDASTTVDIKYNNLGVSSSKSRFESTIVDIYFFHIPFLSRHIDTKISTAVDIKKNPNNAINLHQ